MRFLFAVPDMAGNSPPILELARRLAARGHSVRMLAAGSLKSQVERRGCSWVPFQRAPDDAGGPDATGKRGGMAEFARIRDRLMFGPALDFARDLLDELEVNPADAAAIDTMIPGALVGAEAAGIPSASLLHSVYMFPAPGLPAFGAGLFPPKTWLGRARDRLINAAALRIFDKGLGALNRARAEFELDPLGSVLEASHKADRVLVMTSAAFDIEAEELPPNVRYVGPQLEPQSESGWGPPWPTSDSRPLVLVGLSTDQMGQEALLGRIIQVLGEMNVRALVTTGPSIDPERFEPAANVVVRSFVPHADVMPHASLVITHAGHGTVIRALAAGAPLVCIPLGRDQYDVAARVVWRGAGVKMSAQASTSALKRAIATALKNESFRAASQRMAQAISRETAEDKAVRELEALASPR
jgi:MGT family glycosyltransferase